MWDELKSERENDAEIERQAGSVAGLLGLEREQVFPVSAQKALVGKINGDMPLLEKSRIGALEAALFNELIPARRDIIREQLALDMDQLVTAQNAALTTRVRDIVEQLQELKGLRGKNQNVIAHMMKRVDAEKKEFDGSLFKLQGTRAVFTRLSTELYTTLGMDLAKQEIAAVREQMESKRFGFNATMRESVRGFFDQIKANLDASNAKTVEISSMMESMYRKFASEHGLQLAVPMGFSLDRYRRELDRIEAAYHKQFGATTMLMTSRGVLIDRFFDTIASSVRKVFRSANADVEAWLKVIMAPLEAQIRQHKEQLKHRLASIERIHDATDSLEQKIASFEASQAELEKQRATLSDLAGGVTLALDSRMTAWEAAA
jgi:hypothetical protein